MKLPAAEHVARAVARLHVSGVVDSGLLGSAGSGSSVFACETTRFHTVRCPKSLMCPVFAEAAELIATVVSPCNLQQGVFNELRPC